MSKFKFIEKLLWFYIVLLPIMEVPNFPLLDKKLEYADLLFIILFITWMLGYAKGKFRLKWHWFDFAVLLLLLAYLPSFCNSSSHITSIIELAGLMYLASLYFLIKNIIDTEEKFIYLARIWVIVSVFVVLIGMIALAIYCMLGQLETNAFIFYTRAESSYHMLPRIDSVFRNANMLASYLLASIVLAFILLYRNFENKKKRFLIICALVILFLGAFFTGSRQQVGIYLSSLLILSKFNKNRFFLVLKNLALLAFIILLIVGVLTTVWTIVPVDFKNNIKEGVLTVKINSKYSWHVFPTAVSIKMIKDHPFIGVGLGNYGKNFSKYVDWEKAESSYCFFHPNFAKAAKDRKLVLDPLSTYFGSFAETGLVGFGALLVLFSSFVFSVLSSYKNKSNNFKQQLSWFILSGFFGFLINGFIIEILTLRHFWITMAMGMAINHLKDTQ